MTTEQFAPVSATHPVMGKQTFDTQAKLDAALTMGFVLDVAPKATTNASAIPQRTQEWTKDFKKAKKVIQTQNENRRYVHPDVQENDSFRAKCIQAKLVNLGKPDEYSDTQVSYIAKDGSERKTCIATQDFHDENLEITITAIPRANGDGLRWNSSI